MMFTCTLTKSELLLKYCIKFVRFSLSVFTKTCSHFFNQYFPILTVDVNNTNNIRGGHDEAKCCEDLIKIYKSYSYPIY